MCVTQSLDSRSAPRILLRNNRQLPSAAAVLIGRSQKRLPRPVTGLRIDESLAQGPARHCYFTSAHQLGQPPCDYSPNSWRLTINGRACKLRKQTAEGWVVVETGGLENR